MFLITQINTMRHQYYWQVCNDGQCCQIHNMPNNQIPKWHKTHHITRITQLNNSNEIYTARGVNTCLPAKNNLCSSGFTLNFCSTNFLNAFINVVLDAGIVTDWPVSIILTCTYMTVRLSEHERRYNLQVRYVVAVTNLWQ